MTEKNKNFLALLIAIVIVFGVSFYIYKDLHRPISSAKSFEGNAQKDPQIKGISIETDKPGQKNGYTVKIIEEKTQKTLNNSHKLPNLDLPVKDFGNLDSATFKITAQNIADLTKTLKKDQNDELSWLRLGIYRKTLRDYQAAVEILNYVAILWPNDYVPYNNLADLYQFYLKDYRLAEKNWLKVIELKPYFVGSYENLYNLYHDAYKEKQSESLPILLKGLKNNPENVDLMVYIGRYYRGIGNDDQALIYYNKAADQAHLLKNDKVEASLRTEAGEMTH